MADSPDNIVAMHSDAERAARQFSAEHDRELLTILFTDLVDSTKLQSELGNVEAARLTELHRKIVRDELVKYDAREIEWAGDSCLAVFTKPSDAVVFALKLQAAVREARKTEPNAPTVRVGLHLGEIVVRHDEDSHRDDLFGVQVSEAARIMSLARADQIYCSRAVLDNARSALTGSTIPGVADTAFVNHGAFILKGVRDPVEICEVLDAELVRPKPPEANDKCRPVRGGVKVGTRRVAAITALILLTALAAAAFRLNGGEAPAVAPAESTPPDIGLAAVPTTRRYPLSLPANQPLAPPENVIAKSLDISPDGQLIAYRAQTDNGSRVVVRPLDALEGEVIKDSGTFSRLTFSPDGQWIAAFGAINNAAKLLKFPVNGGAPLAVSDMDNNFFIGWSDDGYLYYTRDYGYGLYRVSDSGGEPEVLTTLENGAQGHSLPVPLPGGRGVAYSSFTDPTTTGATTMALDLSTGESRPILEKSGPIAYLPTGFLILSQLGQLTALPFDAESLEATGAPFDVTQPRMTTPDTSPSRVAVSESGTLIYVPIDLDETDALTPVWVTIDGDEIPTDLPPDRYAGASFSPDGRTVALVISNGDIRNIWLHDLERGTTSRITYENSGLAGRVLWTHDGQSILYSSIETGSWALHRQRIDGSGESEVLVKAKGGGVFSSSLSPDGSDLVYQTNDARRGRKLHLLSLADPSESRPILDGPGQQINGVIAPNGDWIAYASNESGRYEVYLQSYPEPGSKRQISSDGGGLPFWSNDGDTLYFVRGTSNVTKRIYAVEINWEPEPAIGISEEIASGPYLRGGFHPEGTRFLMFKSLSRDVIRVGGTELIVVENWHEEVRQRQPLEAQ